MQQNEFMATLFVVLAMCAMWASATSAAYAL